MNTAAMEQPTKYWGMWGPRRSGSTTATGPSPWPAVYAGEPSWEELAFARDAAGHLGGCVWPPRSYTCSFCRREFRSAQALGGHMNVHRRDRARLRQCASSDDIHDAHQPPQPISPCAPLDQPQHQDTVAYRALLLSNHNSPTDLPSHEAVASSTTTPPSYISAIIKESKNKTFTATGCDHDAADGNEEDRMRKRRRVEHPAVLPFLARLSAVAACEREELQGVDDAKVPKTKSPSSSSFLVYQQEVDLELRLGSSPKVT